MYRRTELFIDGQWVAPSTDAVIEVVSPHTEQVIGQAPAAAPADVDRAVAAARAAFDDGPWPRLRPGRTHRGHRASRGRVQGAPRGDGRADLRRDRRAHHFRQARSGAAAADARWRPSARSRRDYPWNEARPGFYGNDIRVAQAAGRGRGRRRAVEHAAVPDHRQGRARAARRLHRRAQTGAGVGAGRAAVRRDRGAGRASARRGQRGTRRPRDRRPSGRPSRRGQGVVHRFDRGRPPGRDWPAPAGLKQVDPGTRRQVRGHRARRRRPGRHRQRPSGWRAWPTAARCATR